MLLVSASVAAHQKLDIRQETVAPLTKKTQVHRLYKKARHEQHHHDFTGALLTLDTLLAKSPGDLNGLLMQANILSLRGQFGEAKESCSRAAHSGGMDIYLACLSDIFGKQGHSERAYLLLAPLIQKMPVVPSITPPTTPSATQKWFLYLAAEHLFDLGRAQESVNLLARVPVQTLPNAALLLWADAQLALQNHTLVLHTLQSLPASTHNISDALLNRLAMAEQGLTGHHWQKKARARAALREARGDTHHMAELARFYLYIEPDAAQALKWATKNWITHKAADDRRLLQAAKARMLVLK